MEKENTGSQEECCVVLDPSRSDPNVEQQAVDSEKWITIFRLLWDSRDSMLRAAGFGLAVSLLVAFIIPKRYTTSTRLMPPDSQSATNTMMLAGMADKVGSNLGAAASDLLGLKSSGALFVGMLQSETIQDHIVQQFELRHVYRSKLMEDARKKLTKNTDVQEDRKSGIITVTVTDWNPQRAAGIANAYVSELNTMVSELSTSSAHREHVFLEGRLQSVKADLDSAESQLAQFSSKNNTLDMQQQGKAMLDAAASLSGQMIAAESELEGMRQIYTENNARVRELRAQVAQFRKELDRLDGSDGNRAPSRQDVTDGSVESNSDSPDGMPYPSIRKLPLLGEKYADYYRETKIQETVYELLTEQNELAKVEEAKETPSVKVLDPAQIPEQKSYPPRLLIVCAGTLIAVAFSILAMLASQRWRNIGPDDQSKVLVCEILASFHGQFAWLPGAAAMLGAPPRMLDWFRSKPSGTPEERV